MPMSPAEKKLVFSQFVRFIVDVKNLISLLKQNRVEKEHIESLMDSILPVVDEYYLNLSLCDSCGHPLPVVPSIKIQGELDKFFDRYEELCEVRLGETLDSSVFQTEQVRNSLKRDVPTIEIPEDLKSRVKKENPKRFTGTLMKISG